jgi:hypothetical protein
VVNGVTAKGASRERLNPSDDPVELETAVTLGKRGAPAGNRNAAKNKDSTTTFVSSDAKAKNRGAAYILARLDRDGPAALAAKVRAGTLSGTPWARFLRGSGLGWLGALGRAGGLGRDGSGLARRTLPVRSHLHLDQGEFYEPADRFGTGRLVVLMPHPSIDLGQFRRLKAHADKRALAGRLRATLFFRFL